LTAKIKEKIVSFPQSRNSRLRQKINRENSPSPTTKNQKLPNCYPYLSEILTAKIKEKIVSFPQSRNSRRRQKINREKFLISHNKKSEIAKLPSIFIRNFNCQN
ncbi:MAG: hypothetical protein SWX82_20775, partial [Cyanobacteriota bacterium]|nr:hypothetical protein [Cyanobacteriota bacterium]